MTKKTMNEFAAPILEAWATWEMLRRLQFSASDIFWEFVQTMNAIPGPGIALNVVLRTQGKDLTVTCSHRLPEDVARQMHLDADQFQKLLSEGHFDETEMKTLFEESYAWKNKVGLLNALRAKGFAFPFKMN